MGRSLTPRFCGLENGITALVFTNVLGAAACPGAAMNCVFDAIDDFSLYSNSLFQIILPNNNYTLFILGGCAATKGLLLLLLLLLLILPRLPLVRIKRKESEREPYFKLESIQKYSNKYIL